MESIGRERQLMVVLYDAEKLEIAIPHVMMSRKYVTESEICRLQ